MLKKLFILIILLSVSTPALAESVDAVNPDSIPFAPPVNYVVWWAPRSVFCADLDGDGFLDLAVASNAHDRVYILKNNGDGTRLDTICNVLGDGLLQRMTKT